MLLQFQKDLGLIPTPAAPVEQGYSFKEPIALPSGLYNAPALPAEKDEVFAESLSVPQVVKVETQGRGFY